MNSRDIIKHGKARSSPVPSARPLPPFQTRKSRPSILEVEPSEAAPRHDSSIVRWSIAFAIVGICVFVMALFAYVLRPAIATLVDPSVTTWSGDGP